MEYPILNLRSSSLLLRSGPYLCDKLKRCKQGGPPLRGTLQYCKKGCALLWGALQYCKQGYPLFVQGMLQYKQGYPLFFAGHIAIKTGLSSVFAGHVAILTNATKLIVQKYRRKGFIWEVGLPTSNWRDIVTLEEEKNAIFSISKWQKIKRVTRLVILWTYAWHIVKQMQHK